MDASSITFDENEVTVLRAQAQVLRTLSETLSLPINADLLLPGLEVTLNGVETTVSAQVKKIQVYGSHLLFDSTTPGDHTEGPTVTDGPTDGTTNGVTDDTHRTTDSAITDLNDISELIKRAGVLQERARNGIKKLAENHKIPEALNLESSVKRMEQLIDELKIYLSEMNSIKEEIKTVENKITDQLKSL